MFILTLVENHGDGFGGFWSTTVAKELLMFII